MILITYFDRTLGPRIYLTSPNNLKDLLDKEDISQIISLLDTGNEGFFSHYFSPELKTANWILHLESEFARGRLELIMITIIITEEEPDFSYYEDILSKFVSFLNNESEMYKAFYKNSRMGKNGIEINRKYEKLESEIEKIYKILSVKTIETEGNLISFKKLTEKREIKLSEQVLNRLQKISNNSENCFIVYRTRGDSTKIDLIPVSTDKIIRLAIIFGEQMTVRIVQNISQVFSKYQTDVKLVFTSGVCQEIDKCIYEVYIDPDMEKLNAIIEEIYEIDGVLSIEVKLIEIS